jgi:hypothetical protein
MGSALTCATARLKSSSGIGTAARTPSSRGCDTGVTPTSCGWCAAIPAHLSLWLKKIRHPSEPNRSAPGEPGKFCGVQLGVFTVLAPSSGEALRELLSWTSGPTIPSAAHTLGNSHHEQESAGPCRCRGGAKEAVAAGELSVLKDITEAGSQAPAKQVALAKWFRRRRGRKTILPRPMPELECCPVTGCVRFCNSVEDLQGKGDSSAASRIYRDGRLADLDVQQQRFL